MGKRKLRFSKIFNVIALSLMMLILPASLSAAPYRYHHGYNYGYGYHGHYGPRARVGASYHSHNNTLGYIFLGLLGLYVLHEIFDSDTDENYERHPSSGTVVNRPRYRPISQAGQVKHYSSIGIEQYHFKQYEGWQALDNHNYPKAMQIFAIQSQQNLTSGIPKIGFALAVAASGQLERGIFSMRKALKHDPASFTQIKLENELKLLLNKLHSNYQLESNSFPNDNYFLMMAAISYLNNDKINAKKEVSLAGVNESAKNLAFLITELK